MANPQKVTSLLVLGSKPFARNPRNVIVNKSSLE